MKTPKVNNTGLDQAQIFQSSLFGLDLQAYIFLSNHYNIAISHYESLEIYLFCWQYESLLLSLIQAQKQTSFYRERLGKMDYLTLLENFKSTLKVHISQKTLPDKAKIEEQFKALLKRLPHTSPYDIVQNSEAFLALSQDEVEGIVSVNTSGSSKNKTQNTNFKRIYSSSSDLESTIDFYYYGMENVFIGDLQTQRVAMLMSGERIGNVGHLMKCAMERKNIPCEIIGFSYDYEGLIQKLIAFQPTCIIAIPWHIFALSQEIAYVPDLQRTELRNSVRSILLSGDTCSDIMKAQLAQNFDCPVFRHFGMTEFGLGGSVECKKHNAMHVRGLDTYIEIIPDKSTQNLYTLKKQKHLSQKDETESQIYGEIVITSLTREAMPLIRYRTGDIGRLHEKCSCSSIMQQLEVIGRPEQALLLKNNFVHIADFQDIFCKIPILQDFNLEVRPFPYDNKYAYILICTLHFLKLSQCIGTHAYIKQKENTIAKLVTQLSSLFSLQYIEKKTILKEENNSLIGIAYTPNRSIEFFTIAEHNTQHKEPENPQFPKKKIYY